MKDRRSQGLLLCAMALIGCAWIGATEEPQQSVLVTVKGVLHNDKHGFFLKIEDVIYDVNFNEENSQDMQKFYAGLEGDMVQISGELHVQEVKEGKPYLAVYTTTIARLKGQRVVLREQVVSPPAVVVREHYVERRPGIRLPFVRINW